ARGRHSVPPRDPQRRVGFGICLGSGTQARPVGQGSLASHMNRGAPQSTLSPDDEFAMRVPRGSGPRCAFVAATSLTLLKSPLRRAVRPVAGRLYEAGVTANQVTSTSLVGSVLVGALLCRFADHSSSFAILPAWLVARTAFAAIDGTLAVEF